MLKGLYASVFFASGHIQHYITLFRLILLHRNIQTSYARQLYCNPPSPCLSIFSAATSLLRTRYYSYYSNMATTVADDVALDASVMDDLNSPEAKALLDTIDKLRSINVGDIISLPQIIVVGDQSSGKSSVLEAISRVPFPVKGDLCTRFATELVLRLSSTSYVNVTIRFAKGSSGDQEPFHREELDLSRLPSLIEEATERMGIRPGSDVGFSRDVLRIEVSGPDVPSLTLVDLPGFYHSSTGEQSLEGIKIVNRLVKSYMAQEQSIILAVLSASTQLASQRILDETREHDPKRLRTLGVITKPNVPKPGLSNEAKYLQLARNEEPRPAPRSPRCERTLSTLRRSFSASRGTPSAATTASASLMTLTRRTSASCARNCVTSTARSTMSS